jgi:hypothetical protein
MTVNDSNFLFFFVFVVVSKQKLQNFSIEM